jgi:tRNA guanosine-2'-O-methyltransferase
MKFRLLKSVNETANIVHSTLAVAGYALMYLDLQKEKEITDELLRGMIAWTLSNHSSIRKVAHMVVGRLLSKWRAKGFGLETLNLFRELNDKYLVAILQFLEENWECKLSLESPFFLDKVDPLNVSDSTTAFFILAKDEAQIEAIDPQTFQYFANSDSKNPPKLQEDQLETEGPAQESAETEDFQKKILPWSDIELDQDLYRQEILTEKNRQQLIVVATLIDKIPNLAGLARTAEIFNSKIYNFGSN